MTKQKKPENPRDCWRTPRWIVREAASYCGGGFGLDCGDENCRSPERLPATEGMRTCGGCRCDARQLAEAHLRLAVAYCAAPAWSAKG